MKQFASLRNGVNTTEESRQAAEMQKAKQFAFRDQKTIWGATKQNFIHPCKHFSWPQLRRNAKKISAKIA